MLPNAPSHENAKGGESFEKRWWGGGHCGAPPVDEPIRSRRNGHHEPARGEDVVPDDTGEWAPEKEVINSLQGLVTEDTSRAAGKTMPSATC